MKPHDDLEAPVALEDHACIASPDRSADQVLYCPQAQTPPCDLSFVHRDLEKRKAGCLFNTNIGGPVQAAQDRSDLVGGAQHRLKLIAEDFDRDIAAHAREQLVETHLDGLRELVIVPG